MLPVEVGSEEWSELSSRDAGKILGLGFGYFACTGNVTCENELTSGVD
jgi:hypothetical protein